LARHQVFVVAAALSLLLIAGIAFAEEAPYTTGSVWGISFVKVKYGMSDDYLKSLSTTWKVQMEEAKSQGLILSYKILQADNVDRDDWNLLLLVEYKNWAAFDGLDAKMRVIATKVVGTVDQQRALAIKRMDVRELIGAKRAQEIFLK